MVVSDFLKDIPVLQAKKLELHVKLFLEYVSSFLGQMPEKKEKYLQLKRAHTARVLCNASQIAQNIIDTTLHWPLLLAALYHDIGRFEQFRQYETFFDALSVNHGLLGIKEIKKHGFLLRETICCKKNVLTSVGLHNRYSLPQSLPRDFSQVLLAVRDADKIDILEIMAQQLGKACVPDPTTILHLHDAPDKFSPIVLAGLTGQGSPSFLDMRYVNDFRLLLCTWVRSLTYYSSYRLARTAGSLEAIVSGLDAVPRVQERANIYIAKAYEDWEEHLLGNTI